MLYRIICFAVACSIASTSVARGNPGVEVVVTNGPDAAVPVVLQNAAGERTHANRPVSDHVVLKLSGAIFNGSIRTVTRILPDGTNTRLLDQDDPEFGFVIPDGKALVLTSLTVDFAANSDPGSYWFTAIGIVTPRDDGGVSQTGVFRAGDVVNDAGRLKMNLDLGSGVVIGAGRFVGLTVSSLLGLGDMYLYGYLVDAQ